MTRRFRKDFLLEEYGQKTFVARLYYEDYFNKCFVKLMDIEREREVEIMVSQLRNLIEQVDEFIAASNTDSNSLQGKVTE